MARNIIITNGVGSDNIPNGTYNAEVLANGYDNTSLTPTQVVITEGTNEYSFSVSASGTLTLHVSEDGTSTGTPVANAIFYRTDSLGTTYGDPITTNELGVAVFNNVPYAQTTPPNVYFKQTASDDKHEFETTVYTVSLNEQTKTYEITNTLATSRTIKLIDTNYSNLPIESATITLN